MLFSLCFLTLLILNLISNSISSPLLMTLIIILYMIFTSAMISTFTSIWLVYALITMFLGGMLILFIYLSSLSTSEKIVTKPSNQMIFFLLSWILTIIFLNLSKMNFSTPNFSYHLLKKLFIFEWNINLIFITLFLLLSMLSFVKLVEVFKGPLKMH